MLLLLTSDHEALVREKGCVNLGFVSISWGLMAMKLEASSCEEEKDWCRRAIGVKVFGRLDYSTI